MKFLLYITALLYLLLPLQFALNPTDTVDLAIVRVCALLIILLFLCTSFFHKKFLVPRGWIAGFFTIFFMWSFFSLFFSPVFSWTLRKIIFFISLFPLFYVLSALFIQQKNALNLIIKATVLGAFIASIIGLLQFFAQFIIPLNTLLAFWTHLTPIFLGGTFSSSVIEHNSWLVHVGSHDLMRAVAFFPDPHVFSFYLGLIAPLSLGLFFSTKKRFWLAFFLIIILADLLTFSRGGYVGLFGGALVGIFLAWPKIKTRARHFLILFAISFITLLFVPHNPVTQRFLSSFDSADTSTSHRIELWTQATDEISERPFLGTGLGAYSHTINPRADYRTPIYVHNLILDISVELGLIGVFFFIGLIVSILIFLYKNRSRFDALFAIISLSIFFFHSLFDTALFSVHVTPILLLIFALGSHYENNTRNN